MKLEHILTAVIISLVILNSDVNAQNEDCPKLIYSYDAAGNRIKRELLIEPCIINDSPSQRISSDADFPTAFSDIKLYPNPAEYFITIESLSEKKITLISIFDTKGSHVRTINANDLRINISLNDLEPGIYFFNVFQGEVAHNYRIIKR